MCKRYVKELAADLVKRGIIAGNEAGRIIKACENGLISNLEAVRTLADLTR